MKQQKEILEDVLKDKKLLYNLYDEKPLVDELEILVNGKKHVISVKKKEQFANVVKIFLDNNEITSVINSQQNNDDGLFGPVATRRTQS